jgi:hypothetical protein
MVERPACFGMIAKCLTMFTILSRTIYDIPARNQSLNSLYPRDADFIFVDREADTFQPLNIRLRIKPVPRFFLERQDKSGTLVHSERMD